MTRRREDELAMIYRALEAKLGRPFGEDVFCKETGVKASEIKYYWGSFGKFIEKMGGKANQFAARLPDDVVFQDYAHVCLHLQKIPTQAELRIELDPYF